MRTWALAFVFVGIAAGCGSSGSSGLGGGGIGTGGTDGGTTTTCAPACGAGEYCTPAKTCAAGCDEAGDCSGATPHCNTSTHQCQGCGTDTDCGSGKICSGGTCVDGCSATQPCSDASKTCCDGGCLDVNTDVGNCGTCGNACPTFINAAGSCEAGSCKMGPCDAGFTDCDGDSTNGCETTGSCVCTPGSTLPCYDGPAGTENVGKCVGGNKTCNSTGTDYGPCQGEVIPSKEICANGIDETCNGVVDDVPDVDGDGWTQCDGDCCELLSDCSKPAAVNPGAYEFAGNSVDDDCDAATPDTTPTACSTTANFTNVTADDVAKAIDLCQTTTDNPPLAQKKWGVIKAEFLLANGSAPNATQLSNMQTAQAAILQDYGTGGVVPKMGPTFAGLSSGRMRDQGDPGFSGTSNSLGSSSQPPPAYLAAHGGALPSSTGCSGACPSGSGANDSVNVKLTIRVPTNAKSLSYQFRFFSAEYWSWQCTSFNDFYLALLQTGATGIPADKNISFDSLNNPVSVNNGFFDVCQTKTCNTCPLGLGDLTGTGMGTTGGGTAWLTTTAPVVSGETMQIEFVIFDVSDNILDSLVILDNFQWSIDPSQVGTHT